MLTQGSWGAQEGSYPSKEPMGSGIAQTFEHGVDTSTMRFNHINYGVLQKMNAFDDHLHTTKGSENTVPNHPQQNKGALLVKCIYSYVNMRTDHIFACACLDWPAWVLL